MKNLTSIEHSIFLTSEVKLLIVITVNHSNIANNEFSNNVHSKIYLRSDFNSHKKKKRK